MQQKTRWTFIGLRVAPFMKFAPIFT